MRPGAWLTEWSPQTHPFGAAQACARGCHDGVSGTRLLSQMIERGLTAFSCRKNERARGLVTLLFSRPVRRTVRPGGLGVGEQVPGARSAALRAIAMVAIFFPLRLAIAA